MMHYILHAALIWMVCIGVWRVWPSVVGRIADYQLEHLEAPPARRMPVLAKLVAQDPLIRVLRVLKVFLAISESDRK